MGKIPPQYANIDYFQVAEFGEHAEMVHEALLVSLDLIRKNAGAPVIIHAPAVRLDSSGYHSKGMAADFHFGGSLSPLEQYMCIADAPLVRGVGFYPAWRPVAGWHVDIRPFHRDGRTYWYRDINHTYHYGRDALLSALKTQEKLYGRS